MQSQATRAARFWAKVARGNDCWLWQGGRNARGYGMAANGKKSGFILAHRFSYELAYGSIPPGLHVCHHCDNPPCVRPDHLFVGTDADNIADMLRKGRYGPPRPVLRGDASWSRNHLNRLARGESHGLARITATQVLEMRRLRAEGKSLSELMTAFSMSKSQTFRIITRQAWAHIP